MVLVDTSVLINYFNGRENEKTLLFAKILERNIVFGISPFTYQEVLQGASNEKEYQTLDEYLSGQVFYTLPHGLEPYSRAARMFFDLRRKGITIRSTIDVMIALTAIENNVYLLHDDKDFDHMTMHIEELHILEQV